MNTIARFEHVSPEQYARDCAGFGEALPLSAIALPRRATVGSAGYDFVCPVRAEIRPGTVTVIPSGLRALMEPGWVLVICPRSSMGRKYGMRFSNTIGIIDSDYSQADNEGHLLMTVTSDTPFTLAPGDRFCQGIFLPVGFAEEAAVTGTRTGGYGSTGT